MDHSVLLISAGIFHPSLIARYWFKKALPTKNFQYERHASLEILQSRNPTDFNAIVCYFHHTIISQPTLEKLENYIHNGGGILAVHSVSASFKDVDRFHNLIGGRFDHHGPVEEFKVVPILDQDPIFPNIEPFTVRDERYIHIYDAGVTVHFGTPMEDHIEPVVWTKEAGKGRICYLSLGHLGSSFQVPQVKSILQTGLEWVCQTPSSSGGTG